jgi:hypothetical protein
VAWSRASKPLRPARPAATGGPNLTFSLMAITSVRSDFGPYQRGNVEATSLISSNSPRCTCSGFRLQDLVVRVPGSGGCPYGLELKVQSLLSEKGGYSANRYIIAEVHHGKLLHQLLPPERRGEAGYEAGYGYEGHPTVGNGVVSYAVTRTWTTARV